MTEKEITALKAVLYLAERNTRLRHGGTYVEDMGTKTERMFIGYTAAATAVSLIMVITLRLL